MNFCTAPMLSLCLCLVWKFANRWSKQRDCSWLSGDMKRGKMEPCQRAACRQGPWASTVGYLSSPPASADVTISSVRAVCTSSYLAVCSLTWFSALQITLGENLQPVCPLRGRDRRQSRRGARAGSVFIYGSHILKALSSSFFLVYRLFRRFEPCSTRFLLQNEWVHQESSLYSFPAHTLKVARGVS